MTMMDGKEKLYFLLEAINGARAIAPSGQPLIKTLQTTSIAE